MACRVGGLLSDVRVLAGVSEKLARAAWSKPLGARTRRKAYTQENAQGV